MNDIDFGSKSCIFLFYAINYEIEGELFKDFKNSA